MDYINRFELIQFFTNFQAYEGDITENEPPKKNVLRHKKYLAWKECEALSKVKKGVLPLTNTICQIQEDARQQYVDLVNTLMEDEKFKKYMLGPTEDCADYEDSAWKNPIPPATNPTVHHDQPPK